jgi:hypothetical protein
MPTGRGLPQGKTNHCPSRSYTFNSPKSTLDEAAERDIRRSPLPLVFVQMDNPGDFESCFADTPGVVCFSGIPQERNIDGKYTRWIHPLLLAHASTYHKAQGLTLRNGVVMKPPEPNAELGLAYVGISRVTELEGLTLLGPISAQNFMTRPLQRAKIQQEYARLRSRAHFTGSSTPQH